MGDGKGNGGNQGTNILNRTDPNYSIKLETVVPPAQLADNISGGNNSSDSKK